MLYFDFGGYTMGKREFRQDSRAYKLPKGREYTTPAEAHEHLTGQQSGAEQARLRMLRRMGLGSESGPAADAREAMIRRREQRHRK